jgi:hypothetical protein
MSDKKPYKHTGEVAGFGHDPTGAPGNEHLEPRSSSAESRNEIEIDQRNREPGSDTTSGKRPKGPTTHDITSMNQTGD